MKPLVATVWHTGTNYILNEFKRRHGPDCEMQHTGHELWIPFKPDRFKDRRIITTMRDPYLVAASWANRYDMNSPEYQWHWKTVWLGWERLLTYEPEIRLVRNFKGKVARSAGDPKRMHAAQAWNEWDAFHDAFPWSLVQFAIEIYENVNPDLIVPEPSVRGAEDA